MQSQNRRDVVRLVLFLGVHMHEAERSSRCVSASRWAIDVRAQTRYYPGRNMSYDRPPRQDASSALREAGTPVNEVTVTILRDPESPDWWLANFTWADQSYTTQGRVVDEARYMAADLLKLLGADEHTEATFMLNDGASLAAVLAHPVTPSLADAATGLDTAARS